MRRMDPRPWRRRVRSVRWVRLRRSSWTLSCRSSCPSCFEATR
nr:MAG TPA: hypothetical protein [Caudoviricetes sp.]